MFAVLLGRRKLKRASLTSTAAIITGVMAATLANDETGVEAGGRSFG